MGGNSQVKSKDICYFQAIGKQLILTIILVNMPDKRFRLVYDAEFVPQMRFIERKYHSLIRTTIEQ